MKFNTLATKAGQNIRIEKISKRMAYHQAGYAAAIHLGNQRKQLPLSISKLSSSHRCKTGDHQTA